MIEIPQNYYPDRLEKIRTLLSEAGIDCLLIYNAEKEDPALLPWLLGANIFDSTYLLVTKEDAFIFVPQWFTEEARVSFAKVPAKIIGTPEKATMIPAIKPYIQNLQTIGYAGNAPYKELVLLDGKNLVNIERNIRKIYEVKDKLETKLLNQVNSYTRKYLENLEPKSFVGKTEQQIEKEITEEIKKDGYNLGHLSIVSGERLKKTTAGFPTDYEIKRDDLVCIDLGLEMQTYYSDITKCYFLGETEEKYKLQYELLKKAVSGVSEKITAGTKSKEVFDFIKNEFVKVGLPENSFMPTDLGHGIGTGKHEYPEIGFDESVFEKGMVFTLEPEAKLSDGILVRYEDVFQISQQEKTLII